MAASTLIANDLPPATGDRARELLRGYQLVQWKQTDRVFAVLLALQWLAGIGLALWLSPRAWEGLESHIHPHVWAAVFLGGLIASGPIILAIARPGETITRYTISTAQMLHSAMLIHLSGGRIETHFHVFGSLAFLSFYRDWRVLVPATLVVALDHALRGLFWPESVFGTLAVSPWRWIEHGGWVIFEDIFLIWGCIRGARELADLASRQAELEGSNTQVEAEVRRQTARLESVSQQLIDTARQAGMAEIATGVLHNVGNVLNNVNVAASVALDRLRASEVTSLVRAGEMLRANQANLGAYLTADERGKLMPAFLVEVADCLGEENKALVSELQSLSDGLDHIKQIVGAQQQHAKAGAIRQTVAPAELWEQAIALDLGARDEELEIVRRFDSFEPVALDRHRVLQILINLLSNAKQAVLASDQPTKRVELSVRRAEESGGGLRFEARDNGVGIATENLARIFSHGFTTRPEGHGFGLHSAANSAREMGGQLSASSPGLGQGAVFTLELPMFGVSSIEQLLAEKGLADVVRR